MIPPRPTRPPLLDAIGPRLVVAGGRAPEYPRLRLRDVSVDINPAAQPHIIADVRRLPIASNVFRRVYFERIPFPAIVTRRGAGLDEAVRVLQPGGRLRIETGHAAPVSAITGHLRRLGMRHITVDARPGRPLRIDARKPGRRPATSPHPSGLENLG